MGVGERVLIQMGYPPWQQDNEEHLVMGGDIVF